MNNSAGKLHQGDKVVSLDKASIILPYPWYSNPQTTDEKKVVGLLQRLQSNILKINIFENMFSVGLTGNIELRDSNSIPTAADMKGLEFLLLQFSLTGKTIQDARTFGPMAFSIYKQTNRTQRTKGSETYTLNFCSPEIISSFSRRFSKSYNDTPENIVKDIVTAPYGLNSKKPFRLIEDTKEKIKFVVPYLRAAEVLKLLTLQGQTKDDETNYMFFETLEGYYYTSFKNLLHLAMSDSNIPTIYADLGKIEEVSNTQTKIKADQLEVVSGFDSLYAISEGYFSSVTIAPDVLSGLCSVEISSIANTGSTVEYNNRQKLNDKNFYPADLGFTMPATAKIFLVPTTHISASNPKLLALDPDTKLRNNFIAQTLDGRNRELVGLQLRTIRGTVSGAPEIHAGKIVNVVFPSPLNNKNYGSPMNDVASGRYIVVAAQHSIVSDGHNGFFYQTNFEAVTDSRLP